MGMPRKLTLTKGMVTSTKKSIISHTRQWSISINLEKLVVFDAGAKSQSTSLNENILKGPAWSVKQISWSSTPARQAKFCVMADIEMFQQVMAN